MRPILKSRLRAAAFVLGAWVVVSALFAAQSAVRMNVPLAKVSLYSFASWLPVVLFTPFIGAVAKRFRFKEGDRARSTMAHAAMMLTFMIVGAAMMGALEWLIPGDIAEPMTLARAMLRAIPAYMAIDVLTYVLIAAAFQAIAYSRESRERTLMAAELATQLAQARMHVLTAQLHPHFLFNTLNGISALVRENPKRAEQLIARLSELLRNTLDEHSADEISLRDELDLLGKYLEIQDARFGDRLTVTVDPDMESLDFRVPRLILQPLVENAIRHGIAPRAAGGTIEISSRVSDLGLTVAVRDDGIGLDEDFTGRKGLGLSITRARLQQFAGTGATLTLDPEPGGGTKATLYLPTIAQENGDLKQ